MNHLCDRSGHIRGFSDIISDSSKEDRTREIYQDLIRFSRDVDTVLDEWEEHPYVEAYKLYYLGNLVVRVLHDIECEKQRFDLCEELIKMIRSGDGWKNTGRKNGKNKNS